MGALVSVKLDRVEDMKFSAQFPDGRKVALASGKGEELGEAFSPMELFLVALAGCTGMDFQWIMSRQRQKLDELEIQIQGTRRDEDPMYYERIDLKYKCVGSGIRKDAVERAIRLSQEKYCSVLAMLKQDVKVTTTYEIADGRVTEKT